MNKILEAIIKYNGSTVMPAHWTKCVSVATSVMSISWLEVFFENRINAYGFEKFCREAGYTTLMVTPEEY